MARIPKRKIKIRRGDTYTHLVTEYDSDGELDDLTGSTFLVQLRETPEATTAIATFTTELVDATNGEWQFSLTATETNALPAVCISLMFSELGPMPRSTLVFREKPW